MAYRRLRLTLLSQLILNAIQIRIKQRVGFTPTPAQIVEAIINKISPTVMKSISSRIPCFADNLLDPDVEKSTSAIVVSDEIFQLFCQYSHNRPDRLLGQLLALYWHALQLNEKSNQETS
ncbi:MAG: hypothetical protein QXW98_06770 [Candidatus Caldarchaeum sp.]